MQTTTTSQVALNSGDQKKIEANTGDSLQTHGKPTMRTQIFDFAIAAIVMLAVCYLMSAANKRDEFLQQMHQQEITTTKEDEIRDSQKWRELDAQSRAMTSFDVIVSSNK